MNWILWFNGWKWAFVMHYFAIRGHYSMNMLFAHDLLPLFHIINCTVGYINMSFTESCRWTKSLYAHDHAWITSLCLIHEKAVQSMSLLIERWRLCLCFFLFILFIFLSMWWRVWWRFGMNVYMDGDQRLLLIHTD